MKLKKVGMPALIWSACWLLGNLMNHVSAQEATSVEQNHAAEYVITTEQSWWESAFYRTIIENNIFRPLSWTPPKPTPVYRLLGTVISTEGAYGEAILQEIASEQIHFLRVGDKAGDTTVTEIHAKAVKLEKAGKSITLRLDGLQFLSPRRTQDGGGGRSGTATRQTSQPLTYPVSAIESVSKEERRKLIQRYYPK